MPKVNSKRGFTIIEVVLVLAIAGLIFLMVFIALPAMQRSQRDTQRRDQLSMLMTQITQYQANNRNKLPTGTGTLVIDNGQATVTSGNEWGTFYNSYLTKDGAEPFEDPNGTAFTLDVQACSSGAECPNAMSTKFEDQYDTTAKANKILIVTNANCDGEKTVYNSGARKVAITYKLEGGGTYCSNN